MQRKSKELQLDDNKEVILPSEGGLLKYPTDAVLTVQVGTLDDVGQFSKYLEGAGCKALLVVLKKVDDNES